MPYSCQYFSDKSVRKRAPVVLLAEDKGPVQRAEGSLQGSFSPDSRWCRAVCIQGLKSARMLEGGRLTELECRRRSCSSRRRRKARAFAVVTDYEIFRLITSFQVTSGEVYDGHMLSDLLDQDLALRIPFDTVAAETGYDDGGHHYLLQSKGMHSAIHWRDLRTMTKDPNKQIWLDLIASSEYQQGW